MARTALDSENKRSKTEKLISKKNRREKQKNEQTIRRTGKQKNKKQQPVPTPTFNREMTRIIPCDLHPKTIYVRRTVPESRSSTAITTHRKKTHKYRESHRQATQPPVYTEDTQTHAKTHHNNSSKK